MAQQVSRPAPELLWTLVAHNADGILVVGEDERIRFANEAAARLFGLEVEVLVGKPFGQPVVNRDKTEVTLHHGVGASGGAGGQRVAEMRVVPVYWQGESCQLVSLRDMSDRYPRLRQLEGQVIELEEINQELESISHSISHDLWAYARRIEQYTHQVLERTGDSLEEEWRSQLRLILETARRMKSVVEDLLQFSRIRHRPLQPKPLNLGAIAQGLTDYFHALEPDRTVTFLISPHLAAYGDERQLEIVLENLLTNAWKYTRQVSGACIEVGQVYQLNTIPVPPGVAVQPPVYFVRDNGVGFDASESDRIFLPFQRISHQPSYEGNGVGLAIVKRIVNRHQGRIWAVSAPGQGSTFYFTLALQP